MPRKVGELSTPALPNNGQDQPQELPHGLIAPPQHVCEILEQEKAKTPPNFFLGEAWQRLTNELTLQYYFEDTEDDVLYRSTPSGPEVLAVGFDESQAATKDMLLEDELKLETWMP
jgi:hypothetical protein